MIANTSGDAAAKRAADAAAAAARFAADLCSLLSLDVESHSAEFEQAGDDAAPLDDQSCCLFFYFLTIFSYDRTCDD